MSPRRSRACPTSSRSRRSARRRDGFMDAVRALSADPARAAARPVVADRAARNRDRARRARGRGRSGAGLVAHGWLAATTAAADPAGARLVPADLRDRAGQPPARRHDRLDAALYAVQHEAGGDRRRPARPTAPVGGSAIRFEMCASPIPAPARPALDGCQLDVPAGATVALVGPSGAGKTTHRQPAAALLGPGTGRIVIDGVDLRDLSSTICAARIALVSQDTYLFNDTLRANVLLARPEADERGDRDRASTRPRWPSLSPTCPRGSTPGSASAACSCPAGSASASRSPARS